MYSVDTNIYLDWWERRYPADLFPTFKDKVEALIAAGKWAAVARVAEEINHNGTTPLKAWANTHKRQFIAHDTALLTEANAIIKDCPGLLDPDARHDEADRYVIALAKLKGWTVVTHETPAYSRAKRKNALRSHYIPDACREFGVPCIDLLELMRREKWQFR